MATIEIIESSALLIALITLIVSIKQQNKQRKLDFFADYTKRYQEITLHLPINITDPDFSFSENDKQDSQILRYLRVYFDLCSEEYYLYDKKKIEEKVWTLWSTGIKSNLRLPAYREAWHILSTSQNTLVYDDKFVAWVNEELKTPKTNPDDLAKVSM